MSDEKSEQEGGGGGMLNLHLCAPKPVLLHLQLASVLRGYPIKAYSMIIFSVLFVRI